MISVLIVTHNSAKWIGPCLESLAAHGADCVGEVLVVDNASSDGTPDEVRRFANVTLVASPRNLGFAGGINLAAARSAGSSLLILNPDAIIRGPLAALEEALERSPDVVAVAPRLVDAGGVFQRGFAIRSLPSPAALLFEILLLNRLVPNNPVNRRYRCLDFNAGRDADVEQPAGACLLLRRSAFEAVGGFDENFFPLWFEDVDLCCRLREEGGRLRYFSELRVEHAGGHSLEAVTFPEKQLYWYRNMLYYVAKHYSWGTGILIRAALLVGVGLRMVAELTASVLNRATPSQTRSQRLRGYARAALLSVSAGESRPRVRA